MQWLGIDIGGANIKVADGLGFARCRPFPLWRAPGELALQLREIIALAPAADAIAVTMTGELADCFATRRDGVRFILDAVDRVRGGRPLGIYSIDGRLRSRSAAGRSPALVAAANWHALARYATRFVPRNGVALVIDIGSTTTDIIPVSDQRVLSQCHTDLQRLQSGELVYTGVSRSPVCSVVSNVRYRGRPCGIARELFATMRDAYVFLGRLPKDESDRDTADGQPMTKSHAKVRLGRMLCADQSEFRHADAVQLASDAGAAQVAMIRRALVQVAAKLPSIRRTYIISGMGEFLANDALPGAPSATRRRVISLTEFLGSEVSIAAPAHALAILAREGMAREGTQPKGS